MKRNVKTIVINIPSENILKRINITPTLARLSRLKLQVGDNIEKVNHKQFADMERLFTIIGVTIKEIK